MADDADRMVARAIESVLDQVPATVDTSVPEAGAAKLQPWAETAAPMGRNKRPLEELLAELTQRVAADPQARATLPRTRHPALAFFDRFGRTATPAGPGEGAGRRRRRRRGGGGAGQAGPPVDATRVPAGTPADRPGGGRRRSRRGRGGGGGQAAGTGGGAPRQDGAAAGPTRAPGSGGRRRRGRRGRGGDRPPAG
ncbi:MAG: hypothetical protein ACRENL_01875 [Candidatus Dormibacteria bacterium]